MADERTSLSPLRTGLNVLWATCWTGLPIKLALAVLILAMGLVHFEGRLGIAFIMVLISPVSVFAVPTIVSLLESHLGEGIGLPLLFVFSIPIDIWAFGVVGRTFFLEHLQKEPPPGLGFTLWWKSAFLGAGFMPILWYLVSATTAVSVSTSHSLLDMESLRHVFNTGIPIAERISIELTLWGSIVTGILVVMSMGGLFLIGVAVRHTAKAAAPASGNYQQLITRWDLMRVPADQGLMLTVISGMAVLMSVWFWIVLPVTTTHPHECCIKPEVKVEAVLKPAETLLKNEKQIAELTAQLDQLEAQKAEDAKKDKSKGKGHDGNKGGPSAEKKP
jgi:hypothetical protein